jgi:ABC transport system ATP-binding/permease protein
VAAAPAPATVARPAVAPARTAAKSGKLSYKELRELDALPARIEALEAERARIAEQLASADLYKGEPQRVPVLQARHEAVEAELMAALVAAPERALTPGRPQLRGPPGLP